MSDEMTIQELNIVSEFSCLAADCPVTCCRRWNVMYDPDTYRRILKRRDKWGRRLRLHSAYHKELGAYAIQPLFGRCPYYRKHLCRLQCDGLEDCMPMICRLYPRRSVAYPYEHAGTPCVHREVTLELSCIHAAEILIMKKGPVSFVTSAAGTNYEIFWEQKNSDESFLRFLHEDRERIADYWWSCNRMNSIGGDVTIRDDSMTSDDTRNHFVESQRDIYRYVYAEYMWIIRNRQKKLSEICLPLSGKYATDPELMAPEIGRKKVVFGFYPVSFVNEMIYKYLMYPGMRIQNPSLAHLLRLYEKQFGKVRESDAELRMIRDYESMVQSQPLLHETVLTYYNYLLVQTYCEAYEDYYILGPVLLASFFTELLMILFILAAAECGKNGETMTIRRQAEVIACMEKSLRHKNSLSDYFLQEIRDAFFSKESVDD